MNALELDKNNMTKSLAKLTLYYYIECIWQDDKQLIDDADS